jgi:amino acid transporter
MLLIGSLSLVIGIVGTQEQALLTTLVTFGALTAYILLHVAVLVHFGLRGHSRQVIAHWVSPVIGTAVLLYALWNADTHAKILGLGWMTVGVLIATYFHVSGRLHADRSAGAEQARPVEEVQRPHSASPPADEFAAD